MTTHRQPKSVNVQMPKRREDLIERELPGELLLHDPDADRVHLLNHVAAAVWGLCAGRHSVDEIGEQIACIFAVPLDEVTKDIEEAIARLDDCGLLTAPTEALRPTCSSHE